MIFNIDSRIMEKLIKTLLVNTSKMRLPSCVFKIYNTENLSNEEKDSVFVNHFIIHLRNGKGIGYDCTSEKKLENAINTNLKDEIIEALKQ